MRTMHVAAIAAVLFAATTMLPAQAAPMTAEQAYAQAEKPAKPTVRARVSARYQAMKARWRADRVKFDNCSGQLADAKKAARMSVHRQVEFMEDCMRRP